MRGLMMFFVLMMFANKQNEELFDYGNLTVNSVNVQPLTATALVQKFGKPKKCTQELNEFTGEISSTYEYNGIRFEVSKKSVTLQEINSSIWNVTYRGQNISVGQNAQILKLLFPNSTKNINSKDYQIDVRINNTEASYMQFLVEENKIKVIALSENY